MSADAAATPISFFLFFFTLQFNGFDKGLWQPHHYINITDAATIVDLAAPNPCVVRHPENASRRVLAMDYSQLHLSFLNGGVRVDLHIFWPDLANPTNQQVGVMGFVGRKTGFSAYLGTSASFPCTVTDFGDVDRLSIWSTYLGQ